MDIGHNFRWTTKLEKLFAAEGEKCHGYSWLHNQSAERYCKYNSAITIPTIILSTLSGTATIGQSYLFNNALASSVIIGLMSIGSAMMNTIQSYYGWAKRSESHRIASINYSKIYRFISVEMSLPRESRMTAKDFVKVVREQIDRLGEISPMIPRPIIEEFREKFGSSYPNVAKPEICNGLEKIHVYSNEDEINSLKGCITSMDTVPTSTTYTSTTYTSIPMQPSTSSDNITTDPRQRSPSNPQFERYFQPVAPIFKEAFFSNDQPTPEPDTPNGHSLPPPTSM
jgi:hypothetical protein